MLVLTQEHVVDAGTLYCPWRRRDMGMAECAKCEGFRGLREASKAGLRPLQFVECSQPIPLV